MNLEDVLEPQLADALDLFRDIPIVVTLDFGSKKFGEEAAAPGYSVTQIGKKDSFGVKFHLKEIVGTFIEKRWFPDGKYLI